MVSFRWSCVLLKQTLRPPRRTIPIDSNPLLRWSRRLPRWAHIPHWLPRVQVGLEGCHSAFNATNSIRTCLYFGTRTPPHFLTLSSWDGIQHLQRRSASDPLPQKASSREDEKRIAGDLSLSGLASFGDVFFFSEEGASIPIVALENFTERSTSIFRCRFPSAARLVVGHENHGIRSSLIHVPEISDAPTPSEEGLLPCASLVLYIPQYGTISSLNVVTSLGIALFYAFLDRHCPSARVLAIAVPKDGLEVKDPTADLKSAETEVLRAFEKQFSLALPHPVDGLTPDGSMHQSSTITTGAPSGSVNSSPRVDRRPIHPFYYRKEFQEIEAAFAAYRSNLLAFCSQGCATRPHRFGLSLLYENEYDQRNFGGLIRNANAFLVDHVFYLGRRKYNVVGAVGSYHYTPTVYLGKGFTTPDVLTESEETPQDESASENSSDVGSCRMRWAEELKERVALHAGGPSRWWFLDCGHASLYESSATNGVEEVHTTSAESLQWYRDHIKDDSFLLSLCDDEDTLRRAAATGVVLLVPPEGKLPHVTLLSQCDAILTVLPTSLKTCSAGLASQVGSGIAMQRLSSILHPRLKTL